MSRLKLFIPVFIFIIMSGFLYFGLGNDPTELPSMSVGRPLPSFELPTLDSGLENALKADELKGKPFLMNFWATWCATCLIEHPFFLDLKSRGIKIVGVNYKDDADKAVKWLEKYKNPYAVTVVDAKGRLGFDLGVTGAPETFVVNDKGEIVYRHVGVVDQAVWDQYMKQVFPGHESSGEISLSASAAEGS